MSSTATTDPLPLAKQAAVERYLKSSQARPRIAAVAVSIRPEHNVVGIGTGFKYKEGRPQDKPSVRFYVERKYPRELIPPEFRLPETINDAVLTDVIETGRLRAFWSGGVVPRRAPDPTNRMRPAQPGCSIGSQFSGSELGRLTAGTFGAVVRCGDKAFILSNNHVLANDNRVPSGARVFQPGLRDYGDLSKDHIANLSLFVPLRENPPNDVDCALAEVSDPSTVGASILGIGSLASKDPLPPSEGLKVEKFGRTTGHTTGRVLDPSADCIVDYGGYPPQTFHFRNQVFIEGDLGCPFSQPGDSGSLIVATKERRAVALLVGGGLDAKGQTRIFASPITAVLKELSDLLGGTVTLGASSM